MWLATRFLPAYEMLMNTNADEGAAGQVAQCGVAVMAKASAAGRTKTRLVPPLTCAEAAALNTAFLKDTAENILAARKSASIAGYMAYGPPEGAAFFRENFPSGFGLFDAWFPNLGDCLYFAVCELLRRSHRSAIVLNSDTPTLPTALLLQAVTLLAQPGNHAVLGPAADGGYYLLGLKRPHRRLFEDISWSTSLVAQQTLERAREIGLAVHVLSPWYDVDDARTLTQVEAEIASGRSFDVAFQSYGAFHTAELLRSFFGAQGLAGRLRAAALHMDGEESRLSSLKFR
jgi:uncharacterized protein